MFELILNTLQSADTPACCFFAGTPKRMIVLQRDIAVEEQTARDQLDAVNANQIGGQPYLRLRRGDRSGIDHRDSLSNQQYVFELLGKLLIDNQISVLLRIISLL